MYYDPIERLGFQKKQKINTSLAMLLAIVLIGYFANTSHSQIIKYPSVILLTIFSYYLIMNARKEGFAAGFCVFLGCTIIVSGIFISNTVHYKVIAANYILFTGILCIGIGLIFAYRPSLIQAKNHLPFEYPYPIWNSKNQQIIQFSKNLVSTKKLLTDKERLLSCRFKYLLVLIDGKMYLVSPNEKIPQDSMLIRTKSSKTLCGISRF